MRMSYLSGFFLMLLSLSVLMVTGCDNPNEVEVELAPVEGPLLVNGRVPKISPEGAADLREKILDLSFVKHVNQAIEENADHEDLQILRESTEFLGKFEVIPRSDHYEVTFPHLIRIIPQDPEAERVKNVEINNDMKLRVFPTGDPEAFRVKFEMSEKPFTVVLNTEQGGHEFLSVSYKSGSPVEALWHNDVQSFLQYVGSIQDLTIAMTVPEELRKDFNDIDGMSIKVANVQNTLKLEPDENNLWSGTGGVIMDNIRIDLPQDVGGATVLKLNLVNDIQKINPQAYKAFFESYGEFVQKMTDSETETGIAGAESLQFEDMLVLLQGYENFLVGGYESVKVTTTLSHIQTNLNNTPDNPHTVKNFKLDELFANFDVSGMQEDRANINVAYGLKGLDAPLYQFEAELGGQTPQELVPQNFNVGLGVADVPLKSILDKVVSIMEAADGNEKKAEADLKAAEDEFVKMLIDADAKFKLNDIYVGNDVWLLLVNGTGGLDMSSPYKAIGESEVRFYGLDFLMQKLEERAKSDKTSPVALPMIQQASMGLGMMQMFGQMKKDDKGRDYRSYVFTLSPDGKMKMNGTDLTQMMGMMR